MGEGLALRRRDHCVSRLPVPEPGCQEVDLLEAQPSHDRSLETAGATHDRADDAYHGCLGCAADDDALLHEGSPGIHEFLKPSAVGEVHSDGALALRGGGVRDAPSGEVYDENTGRF